MKFWYRYVITPAYNTYLETNKKCSIAKPKFVTKDMYKNFDKSRKPLKLTPSMTERKNESRFLTRPYNKTSCIPL